MEIVKSDNLAFSESSTQNLLSVDSIIDFTPPFLLRVGALLVDYIVFLILPLAGLVSDRLFGGNGLGIFTDRTIWLLAIVIAIFNAVLLPMISGQTFGKMLTGIRIVKADGTRVGRGALLARQTVGYLLTVTTLGIGFFVSALNSSGRSLHDYVAGTVTVRAQRRLVKA